MLFSRSVAAAGNLIHAPQMSVETVLGWFAIVVAWVPTQTNQKLKKNTKKKNMSQSWKPPHMRGDTRLFFRGASCRCGIHTAEGMWEECERCGGGFSKKGTPEGAYTLVTDCEAQHSALSSHESKCPTFASMFVLRSDLSAVCWSTRSCFCCKLTSFFWRVARPHQRL